MGKQELKYSDELLQLDTERMAEYKAKAKALLIERGAEDLLEMLGLDTEEEEE